MFFDGQAAAVSAVTGGHEPVRAADQRLTFAVMADSARRRQEVRPKRRNEPPGGVRGEQPPCNFPRVLQSVARFHRVGVLLQSVSLNRANTEITSSDTDVQHVDALERNKEKQELVEKLGLIRH